MNNDDCWRSVLRQLEPLQVALGQATFAALQRDFAGVERALDEINRIVTKTRVPLRQVER